MMMLTIKEQYKSRKQQQKDAKILAVLIGIAVVLLIYGVNRYMQFPVMQKNLDGVCLRVLDAEGDTIPDGCKAVKGKKLYKSEYVAK